MEKIERLGQGPLFPIQPVYNPNTMQMDYDHMYDDRMGMSIRVKIASDVMCHLINGIRTSGDQLGETKEIVRLSYEFADELLRQEMI